MSWRSPSSTPSTPSHATLDHLDSTDEHTHDSTRFTTESWLQGRLVLLDLAIFTHRRFAPIDENGGFFVNWLKRSANPEVVEELRPWPGNAKPLAGTSVWDVTWDLYRAENDVLVEVPLKRRSYRRTRFTATRRFRVWACAIATPERTTGISRIFPTST